MITINKSNKINLSDNTYSEILNMYKNKCVFCNPHSELLLLSSKNYNLILDPSPIIEGHLILSSKKHYGCLAEMTPKRLFTELTNFKILVSKVLEILYGSVIFFEHGRAGHCLMSPVEDKLCHHFHLHILPTKIDIHSEIIKSLSFIKIDNIERINYLHNFYSQYLFYEDKNNNKYFYPINSTLSAHFLRTLVAKKLKVKYRANWVNYSNKDNIVKAKNKLIKAFSNY